MPKKNDANMSFSTGNDEEGFCLAFALTYLQTSNKHGRTFSLEKKRNLIIEIVMKPRDGSADEASLPNSTKTPI